MAITTITPTPTLASSSPPQANGSTPLISLSDLVMVGTIGASQTAPGTDSMPVDTLVQVTPQRVIKGSAPSTVTVRVHGGDLGGGRSVRISGEATLSTGDSNLLFLNQLSDGTYRIYSGDLGIIPSVLHQQHGAVPNPVFSQDPSTITAVTSCTGSSQPGYSGFALLNAVWPSSSYAFDMSVNAATFKTGEDNAASTWNASGMAFRVNDSGVVTTKSGLGGQTGNGANVISAENHPEWQTSQGIYLALTATWASNGVISEIDTVFNTYAPLSYAPTSSQYDIESVATHEMGHSLGLNHVSDSNQIMYPCLNSGQIKRSLGVGDKSGAVNLYPPNVQGYYLVDQTGAVYTLGGYGSYNHQNAAWYGGANQNNVMNYPTNTATAIEVYRPTLAGYWILGSDGGVFAYGAAPFKGSAHGYLCGGCRAMAMASTADGNGYLVLGSDGGIFAFGDAAFHGSAAGMLPSGVYATGLAAKPDGSGYWIVSSRGDIYAFGSIAYLGGCYPNCQQSTRGIQSDTSGGGYWILGNDGGIFTFGDAPFHGSTPGTSGPQALSRDPESNGYIFISSAGGMYTYGFSFVGYGTPTSAPYSATAATDEVGTAPPPPPPADFTIGASPSSLTVLPGKSGSSTVTVTANSTFSGSLSYSLSGVPSGSSASISPNPVSLSPNASASSTLSIHVAATQLSKFTVTVTGCGNGVCHSTSVTVTP